VHPIGALLLERGRPRPQRCERDWVSGCVWCSGRRIRSEPGQLALRAV